MAIKPRRFDFWPDEWLGGTHMLTNAERGLYITVCTLMYSRGKSVTVSEIFSACVDHGNSLNQQLSRLISLGKLQRKGDEITQKRVRIELEKARKRSRIGRENVEKRWGNDGENGGKSPKINGIADHSVLPSGNTSAIPRGKANYQPTNYQLPTLRRARAPDPGVVEAPVGRDALSSMAGWDDYPLRQRGQVRRFVEDGTWATRYGPAPGEPGCRLPKPLESWALQHRKKRNG